ncbi:MAG: helix-hairpin-helix domain-containing protein [Prevotella sp.]|nr:helix-hairpin-helix domain-containing protein [Prevotella sp.]
MRRVVLLLIVLLPWVARGQSWQQVYDDMMAIDDNDYDEEAGQLLPDSYELLEQLASHPLDLNSCSREELEQLPFLSSQQVMDLEDYRFRYGPIRSLGELRMIRSLDHPQLSLLPFFVFVSQESEPPSDNHFPRLDSLLHWGHHTLTGTIRIPFYQRQGDKNGYLGYPYRHTMRYQFSSGQHLRWGLIGAQDAGEPFLSDRNRWGYDGYSYYLQVRQLGRLDNLVVGKYKLAAGMGLVLGQSFQLGKLATLQNLGRTPATIRPHSSRSEGDYFHGGAATITLSRKNASPLSPRLYLSAFASHRAIDATLTKNGDAQTLLVSGYHRTPTEMAKKNNTHITAGGTHLMYRWGALRMGATAVYSTLDRSLEPQRQTLYRRHYAHGRHFLNIGADYAYLHHRFALNGETATDGHGALATINAVSFQPSSRISMLALQRFYSYRYSSLYGHSFGEGSRTQNESGIYLGATWNPLARLRLQGYADYAYFPWARYQVSESSHSWDFLAQATWQYRHWTFLARHRSHLRQKDNEKKTALIANDQHRERFSATYQHSQWTMKTQLDMTTSSTLQTERGWMISELVTFHTPSPTEPSLHLSALAAWFDTDSYQSRIYIYERQLPHEFYFPTYYGEGLRLSIQAQADISSHLSLNMRLGYTRYFDRSTISSGLQQIMHSHQSDLDLQLRWKF